MTVVDLPQPAFAAARRLSSSQLAEDTSMAAELSMCGSEESTNHREASAGVARHDASPETSQPVAGDGDVSRTVTPPVVQETLRPASLWSNRPILFATAAVIALVGIAIASMTWQMSMRPPVAMTANEVGAAPPRRPLLAPSAQVARVPPPAVPHFTDERPTHPGRPSDELKEVLAARGTAVQPSVPVVIKDAPSAFPDPTPADATVPGLPLVPTVAASPSLTATSVTAGAPAHATAAPKMLPAPTAAPPAPRAAPDAADQATRLQAAPMSSPQQVAVLQLVTEEAALIRRQRQELTELRADQSQLHGRVDSALEDFGRRLELAEATRAVADAGGTTGVVRAPMHGETMIRRVAQPVVVPASPVPDGPHQYRVQAASPHLAMLADTSQPQDAAGLAVSVGDLVPGLGHVVAISQHGTQWVVKTDRGVIQ